MLGFSPYSAAAFSDLGSGEQLFIPTGVASTGAVGTVAVTGNQSGLTLGSVQGSAVVNDVSVDAGATATFATGQLNGNVSPVTASTDISFSIVGVGSTGQVGALSTNGEALAVVTSPQMSAGVGSTTTASAATFSVTGVAGTGSTNAVVPLAGSIVSVTSAGATGQVGTADAGPDADVQGVEGTGAIGSATIYAKATFSVTGVAGTMSVGTAQGQAGANTDVTGVLATGSVGSVTTPATALVTPTGVSATGRVGQALVWGRIKPDPGTIWTRIAA